MDENAEVAILSHSVGAYVSTLEPSHLKHLATKVVNDTTHWISRLFRYQETPCSVLHHLLTVLSTLILCPHQVYGWHCVFP